MEKIYQKDQRSGMEYIVYEEPIYIKKADVIFNYKDGGCFFYRPGNTCEEIEILAHIKYMDNWRKTRYLREANAVNLTESFRESYYVEILNPVYESSVSLYSPRVMSESDFYEGDMIDKIAKLCMKVYSAKEDEIKFFVNIDKRNKGVILYGYSIGPFDDYEDEEIWNYIETLSYDYYKKKKQAYLNGEKEDLDDVMWIFNDEAPERDEVFYTGEDEEAIESSEIMDATCEEKILPPIAYKIREWLQKVPFTDFSNAITDRVKGQEEAEFVAINIYNYLECVAYGKAHNNNFMMCAPSGCGKTETFRAVRDYFENAIPELVVYQLDMTSITEEGFKGKDTEYIIKPLRTEDDGIGIAFLDEFDKKLIPSFSGSGTNVNLAVQMQILTVIEGRKVYGKDGKSIDTRNTMFIAMGAYDFCRQEKTVVERHIGFKQENVITQNHYSNITREDMIDVGACYELIGRFSTVVNYHELSDNIIDEIIDGMILKVSDSIGCKVTVSKKMRAILHENANGKYGCRILESMIRENAMKGYMSLRKKNKRVHDHLLRIENVGEVACRLVSKRENSKKNELVELVN